MVRNNMDRRNNRRCIFISSGLLFITVVSYILYFIFGVTPILVFSVTFTLLTFGYIALFLGFSATQKLRKKKRRIEARKAARRAKYRKLQPDKIYLNNMPGKIIINPKDEIFDWEKADADAPDDSNVEFFEKHHSLDYMEVDHKFGEIDADLLKPGSSIAPPGSISLLRENEKNYMPLVLNNESVTVDAGILQISERVRSASKHDTNINAQANAEQKESLTLGVELDEILKRRRA
jgi:hypothetical protein